MCAPITLLGGLSIPTGRPRIILRNAFAILIKLANSALREGAALVGGLVVPR